MISGIIMASGFSNRMGQDKLLLKINNKRIIEYVIEAAKESDLNEVVLVYRSKEIKKIASYYNIKTVYNSKAHLGQSQSVIRGIKNSINNSYMFLVGDQPFTDSKVINRLIYEYRKDTNNIIVPCSNGNISMPIIFPSIFKKDLLKIEGDKGGREIIRDNPRSVIRVNINNEYLLKDIDTIEEYDLYCK